MAVWYVNQIVPGVLLYAKLFKTLMENKPTHYAYHVTDRTQHGSEQKSGFWTKIGAAWPHRDGKGFNISIETIPLNGRLVLRERPEEEEETAPEAQQRLPLPAEREP